MGLLLPLVIVSSAHGDDQRAAVERWVAKAWKEAKGDLILPDIAVAYRVEYHEVPPMQEMQRLRRDVQRHPQHPDARKLEVYTDRLANGPSVVKQTMFLSMDGYWRLSRYPTGHKYQVDYGWSPQHAWIMSEEQLTIDALAQLAGSEHDLRSEKDEFLRECGIAILGGLQIAHQYDMALTAIEQSGSNWSFAAIKPGVATLRFWVRSQEGIGVVPYRMTLESVEASPEEAGERWDISDWTIDPALGRLVARRVERYTPDGRLDVVRVIESIVAMDHREIERMCEIPRIDGVDPIRGAVTYRAISDYRPGKPTPALLSSGVAGGGIAPSEPKRHTLKRVGSGLIVISLAVGAASAALLVRARMQRRSGAIPGGER